MRDAAGIRRVSKKHSARRKRKAKSRRHVTCASCAAKAAPGALPALAAALNACADAGIAVKLRHGIVISEQGYVIDMPDGKWEARTRRWAPYAVTADDPDGDQDD